MSDTEPLPPIEKTYAMAMKLAGDVLTRPRAPDRDDIPGLRLWCQDPEDPSPVAGMDPATFEQLPLFRQCAHLDVPLREHHPDRACRERWAALPATPENAGTAGLALAWFRQLGYTGRGREGAVIDLLLRATARRGHLRRRYIAHQQALDRAKRYRELVYAATPPRRLPKETIIANRWRGCVDEDGFECGARYDIGAEISAYSHAQACLRARARAAGVPRAVPADPPDPVALLASDMRRATASMVRTTVQEEPLTPWIRGPERLLDPDTAVALWRAIGRQRLADIFERLQTVPGALSWPDLSLVKGRRPLFVEAKGADRLSAAQGRVIGSILRPLDIPIEIAHLLDDRGA